MIEVHPVLGVLLGEPLEFLEGFFRDGEAGPDGFVEELRGALEKGDLELLAAWSNDEILGVAVIAFRLSISVGGRFASVEELYVRPEYRRRGVGRALLDAAVERCSRRGISYIEVQAVDEEAKEFYVNSGFGVEAGVEVMSFSRPLPG